MGEVGGWRRGPLVGLRGARASPGRRCPREQLCWVTAGAGSPLGACRLPAPWCNPCSGSLFFPNFLFTPLEKCRLTGCWEGEGVLCAAG